MSIALGGALFASCISTSSSASPDPVSEDMLARVANRAPLKLCLAGAPLLLPHRTETAAYARSLRHCILLLVAVVPLHMYAIQH